MLTAAYYYAAQGWALLPPPCDHTRFVWSRMSEADRVFSRMTTPGSLPAPEDKQFLHVTSRRRGAVPGQSRVVEVVHRRLGHAAPPEEQAPAPALPPVEDPAATPVLAAPVGHLMPGWERRLPPLQPAEPVAKSPVDVRRRPRAARPDQLDAPSASARRGFADPFAVDDTGANCIRCGYLVSPARERRGLLTCLRCR